MISDGRERRGLRLQLALAHLPGESAIDIARAVEHVKDFNAIFDWPVEDQMIWEPLDRPDADIGQMRVG
ncbi:MAG: hypothetical protein JWO87_3179 [Phycisphaerales bacterium]|nr:hypothetical protein [Phycisphaerales bacterium]